MFEHLSKNQEQFHYNTKQFTGSMKMFGDKLIKPGTDFNNKKSKMQNEISGIDIKKSGIK